ncbi:MAG: hypothetical protein ACETWC_08725, partial [Acidobacteriota bacterium]
RALPVSVLWTFWVSKIIRRVKVVVVITFLFKCRLRRCGITELEVRPLCLVHPRLQAVSDIRIRTPNISHEKLFFFGLSTESVVTRRGKSNLHLDGFRV